MLAETKPCAWCGNPMKTYRTYPSIAPRVAKVRGRFCGKSCSAKWRMSQPEIRAKVHTPEVWKKSSAALRAAQDDLSPEERSERSRAARAAWTADSMARQKTTWKANGNTIKDRRGNGTGPTLPEQVLWDLLGEQWCWNYPVKTKQPVGSGYPTNYKVDLALVDLKLAVEVDGMSHLSKVRQRQDRKKEDLLGSLGWTVLRFSNQEVLSSPDSVVEQIASRCTTLRSKVTPPM